MPAVLLPLQPYDAGYFHQAQPGMPAAGAAGFAVSPAMLPAPGFGPNPSMHAVTAGLSSSVSVPSTGPVAEERSRAAAAAVGGVAAAGSSGGVQSKLGGLSGLWGGR